MLNEAIARKVSQKPVTAVAEPKLLGRSDIKKALDVTASTGSLLALAGAEPASTQAPIAHQMKPKPVLPKPKQITSIYDSNLDRKS